jgi:hypothetical protein
MTTNPDEAPLSPDGTQRWNGSEWVPVDASVPDGALRSPDGRHWWNGVGWVPIPQSQPAATSTTTTSPTSASLHWRGGILGADETQLTVTGDGAAALAFPYAALLRVYVDDRLSGPTITLQLATGLRAYEDCEPRESAVSLVALLRSHGVSVEERRWGTAGSVHTSTTAASASSAAVSHGFVEDLYRGPQRRWYSDNRRVAYGLLWSFYSVVLVVAFFQQMAMDQVGTAIIALAVGVLTVTYAYRIWTWRARRLWLLVIF